MYDSIFKNAFKSIYNFHQQRSVPVSTSQTLIDVSWDPETTKPLCTAMQITLCS